MWKFHFLRPVAWLAAHPKILREVDYCDSTVNIPASYLKVSQVNSVMNKAGTGDARFFWCLEGSGRNCKAAFNTFYNSTNNLIRQKTCLFIFCFLIVYSKMLSISQTILYRRRFRSTCGLRRRFTAAWIEGLWVRIPLRAWLFVCCVCCALLGSGLCNGLITHPEESCCARVCLIACALETS